MATLRFLVLVGAVIAGVLVSPSFAEDYEEEFETSFIFKWHGGFIGEMEIPIEHNITGWNITLTFPKNIYDFEICPAAVVDVEGKRVFHLRNQPWNAQFDEGDTLRMWFNARTWRKIRGLVGQMVFSANVVDVDVAESTTASSDSTTSSNEDMSSSAMGYNNSLTCDAKTSNVTCGSSYEVISKSSSNVYVVEVQVHVDFAEIEVDYLSLQSNVGFTWSTLESSFEHCFEPDSGGDKIEVMGSISSDSDRTSHKYNVDMTDELEEAGRGRLKVRIRFRNAEPTEDPVVFPLFEGTPECGCSRLVLVEDVQ